MPRTLPQSRPQFEQRFAIFSLPPFASCILITSFFPLLSLWKFPQRNEIQWKILIQIAANYWGCKATSSSRYFSLSVFVSLSAPVYLYLCFVFFFFCRTLRWLLCTWDSYRWLGPQRWFPDLYNAHSHYYIYSDPHFCFLSPAWEIFYVLGNIL